MADIEPQKKDDRRGVGFAQVLHDRSRESGTELHKHLLSLSTGTLAVYFLALTARTDPPLSLAQRIVVLVALVAVGIASLSAMVALYADSRRYFYWAFAVQAPTKQEKIEGYRARAKWMKVRRAAINTLGMSFASGIILSITYLFLRVLGR